MEGPSRSAAFASARSADASWPEARAGERARASASLSHATQNQRPIPTEQHANAGTSPASSLITVDLPQREGTELFPSWAYRRLTTAHGPELSHGVQTNTSRSR